MPAINFTGTYSQTFDTLALTGTAVAWNNGTTLTGWYLFNRLGADITAYAAGTGSGTAGSFYSFGGTGSAERAFGGLGSGGTYFGSPASGALAGYMALAATNGTGQTLSEFTLSFDGEQWRNGGNASLAAQSMVLQYGFGADFASVSTWTAPGGNFTWTSTQNGATAGAVDGNTIGLVSGRGGTVSGITWEAGSTLWIRWIENNDVGNDHGLAIDNLTLSADVPVANTVSLGVSSTSASEAAETVITVTVTATQAVVVDETVTLTVTGSVGPADYELSNTTVTIPAGQTSGSVTFKVLNDTLEEGSESAVLTISGPSSGIVLGGTVEQTIVIADDDVPATKISAIQGAGLTSGRTGEVVTIEAIVVGDFQGITRLGGFFVQEEDADVDGDPLTSEGLFIFQGATGTDVQVGDKVRVTGTVTEFGNAVSSLTELSSVTSVVVVGSEPELPGAAVITFPLATPASLEALEGMRVVVNTTLAVTDTTDIARFGNVLLSSDGPGNSPGTDARLDTYTQFNLPSVAGYDAYLDQIALRRIVLDDGSDDSFVEPIAYGRDGNVLSATNTLRSGDTVASITGILDDRFGDATVGAYRIQPTTTVDFDATNARTATAPDVGGSLRVASFNVLNYFNGDGAGGGFPTSRGADSAAEFARQQTKIVSAILGLDADIVGLLEIENDGYGALSAIASLVNALNAAAGAAVYAFINPGAADMGTDQIAVGFIYKPGTVTPVGAARTLTSAFVDPDNDSGIDGFNSSQQRPTLAQTFSVNATGAVFTPVINHLKSKGTSAGGVGDADILDGQGLSNGTRTRAADTLMDWLKTDPTGSGDKDFLILGDLNAYAMEDPVRKIIAGADDVAGTADDYSLLDSVSGYSYSFDGQMGSLDHALASGNLVSQVTGAADWHINADEPEALDYNVENKSLAQQASLYAGDAYRASDHDPVVVGLNLGITRTGGIGNDVLIGTAGNDALFGGPGRDTLSGGAGDDVIDGGSGRDLLLGGPGRDSFVFHSALDFGDRIDDFQLGIDKLVVADLLAAAGFTGNPATAGYVTATVSGTTTAVSYDADGSAGPALARLMVELAGVQTTDVALLLGLSGG